jgi:hypothetical protein
LSWAKNRVVDSTEELKTLLMPSRVNTERVRNKLKGKGMAFALVQKSEKE